MFLDGGHPFRPAYSRQYRSAIFFASEAQQTAAREALRERARVSGRALHTALEPLEAFHRAEDYHQKYGLRHHASLMEPFTDYAYAAEAFVDSTVASRLNGLLAGHGTPELLERELPTYGLPPSLEAQLWRLMGTAARACGPG